MAGQEREPSSNFPLATLSAFKTRHILYLLFLSPKRQPEGEPLIPAYLLRRHDLKRFYSIHTRRGSAPRMVRLWVMPPSTSVLGGFVNPQTFLRQPSPRRSDDLLFPFPTPGGTRLPRAPSDYLTLPPARPLPEPPPTLGRLQGIVQGEGHARARGRRRRRRRGPCSTWRSRGLGSRREPAGGGRAAGSAPPGEDAVRRPPVAREPPFAARPGSGQLIPVPAVPRSRPAALPLRSAPRPSAPPPAPGPTLLVRSSSGSPLSASPSSLQSESKPPCSRAAAAAARAAPGELGSGANIEAGTGESIGERLRSAAIFNNLG